MRRLIASFLTVLSRSSTAGHHHDLSQQCTVVFQRPRTLSQGAPIQVSSYRQQVILNTTTNAFTTVHMSEISQTSQFTLNGQLYQLGHQGKLFRTAYSGQSNAPGLAPSGWFSSYAMART